MADDESRIRAVIESWARAVHQGDMDSVLVDHADDRGRPLSRRRDVCIIDGSDDRTSTDGEKGSHAQMSFSRRS